jgi:hypothetical protein
MQQILAVATEDKHNCRIPRIGAAKNAPRKVIPLYTQAEAERIRSALSVIPANDRIIWLTIGVALHWTCWGDLARLLWDEWSRTSGKFDEADQEETWRSFDRGYDGEKVTLGTLFHLAKEHGWNDQTPTDRRGPSQTDILLKLAQSAELFHSSDGTGFADLHVNGHRETWRLRAKGFRLWLLRCFFEKTGGAPGSEALQSALNVIEARAHFDAPERLVYIRVGGIDGKLYLDLCDEAWRAVEIDATGWRVIGNPPVRFRRAAGMQPLPMPVPGGSVETLRSFLNVQSDSDFVLVVAWALAVLRNRGPYPVIALSGEQGSAKSTFSAILRALLDPNTAPLRALPREDRDLFIAASNGHVQAFDNVSGLPPWISDTLCRLATGGGFAVRQLYTDQDEVLFDAARPVILNGIEDIVTRPDLADRAVFLTLEPIPEERRRPEADLWAAFEAERPRILGALLDAVAHGLERLPETRLEKLPRMADFALWATACETAHWRPGTFWSAYNNNIAAVIENVVEGDPVANAVRSLMSTRTQWTGTASALLGALEIEAGERVVRAKTWPSTPKVLSDKLRRAATFLRKLGISITFVRDARTRLINISETAAGLSFTESSASEGAIPSNKTQFFQLLSKGAIRCFLDAR